MVPRICPSRDALAAFASGRGSEADAASIESHLEECLTCQAALERLDDEGNELIELLRHAPSPRWVENIPADDRYADSIGRAIEGRSTASDPTPVWNLDSTKSRDSATPPPDDPAAAPTKDDPTVASAPSLPAIAGYRVERLLGRGGFGSVYKAHDLGVDRPVAIKILEDPAASPTSEIVDEAKAHGAVEGSGIVPVYSVGRLACGTPFLVCKYLPGGTLKERLEREKTLAPVVAAKLARQIATGLGIAHAKGFVHRDLKPANILFDEANDAFIADFGLAIFEGARADRAGEVAGSRPYMAPEQIAGEVHRVEGRTDLWALGVILYEALSGSRPFSAESFDGLRRAIQKGEPFPLRQRNAAIPEELAAVVEKCLAKRPEDRYAAASDVVRALDRFIDAPEAPGDAAPAPVQASPRASRRALVAGSVVALSVAFAALVAFYALQSPVDKGPLVATIDATVVSERNGVQPLLARRSIPLRDGDQVQIDAIVDRPAHVYAYWIDSNGKAVELYAGAAVAAARSEGDLYAARAPADGANALRVRGPTGLETVFVLVREEPLEDPQALLERFSLPPQRVLRSDGEVVVYELTPEGIRYPELPGGMRSVEETALGDPTLKLARELANEFDLVRVMRIAHVADE